MGLRCVYGISIVSLEGSIVSVISGIPVSSAQPSRALTPKKRSRFFAPVVLFGPQPSRAEASDANKRPNGGSTVDAIVVPRSLGVPWFVQWLQGLVNQCSYGKNLEALLAPERQFEVTTAGGDVLRMRNYNEPPKDQPPFQGVCNDLTYMVGNFLNRHIGTEYVIQPVRGQCDDYFSRGMHFFLLLWPWQSCKAMQAPLVSAVTTGRVPDGCFLLDPSFQRMLLPGEQAEQRQRYRLHRLLSLDDLNPTTVNKDVSMSEKQLPTWFPLGYVKALLPQLLNGRGLLFFGFQKPQFCNDSPQLDFMIMPTTDDQIQEPALHCVQALLPKQHPLKRFVTKINQDLLNIVMRRMCLPLLEKEYKDHLRMAGLNEAGPANACVPLPNGSRMPVPGESANASSAEVMVASFFKEDEPPDNEATAPPAEPLSPMRADEELPPLLWSSHIEDESWYRALEVLQSPLPIGHERQDAMTSGSNSAGSPAFQAVANQ
jgi:hypothetical protein